MEEPVPRSYLDHPLRGDGIETSEAGTFPYDSYRITELDPVYPLIVFKVLRIHFRDQLLFLIVEFLLFLCCLVVHDLKFLQVL